MNLELKKYLHDVLESVQSIDNFIGEKKDFNIYQSNKMLRRAVEREFEIIGEAINRIEKIAPDTQISSKKLIISMRNRVIHGYDKIDNEIIWGAIIKYLPTLKIEIQTILNH